MLVRKNRCMDFNRWWEELSAERYWLEIADRTDLGVDLNAPQTRRDGKPAWRCSLLNEVRDGDIVFHCHKEAGPCSVEWSVCRLRAKVCSGVIRCRVAKPHLA
jgi:hypothetical protein